MRSASAECEIMDCPAIPGMSRTYTLTSPEFPESYEAFGASNPKAE
jgi:hypothetical protein